MATSPGYRSRCGDGVRSYALVPYRTVAVDPKLIPFGTVLYVPHARGTPLPADAGDRVLHDGYFCVADTGSAIRGSQVDRLTP